MGLRNFLFGWRQLGLRSHDLVLEVGSGNRPLARSDVLCDLGELGAISQYGGSVGESVVRDRPFVYADASHLPFRAQSFDFIYCAHMLEHLADPAAFLQEASRVARRGMIVTPSPVFEGMFAERTHLWYVSQKEGVLHLRAKASVDEGPFGRLLQQTWEESRELRRLVWGRPDLFETHYAFQANTLRYEIQGEPPAAVPAESGAPPARARQRAAAAVRALLGRALRSAYCRRRPVLIELLACVRCGGALEAASDEVLLCGCGARYPVTADGCPIMLVQTPHHSRPKVETRAPSPLQAAHGEHHVRP